MSMKEAYRQKIEAQLDEWEAEIDKMKAKADKVGANVQLEYYKRIEELRLKHESVKVRLKELKGASEGAWEDLKIGVDLAWEALSEAMKSANSRYK
ncbi:coiled coil domain-containing protein [Desulfovibrio gilichinskyi]|uniref:Coiled coil domain-containing protein n=1 Tax=Desulfovibrio gilichinskyi TaxID=1519643 RepID=A0A1X7EXY4_9BACT|nr:coiled coil domain-containing protein [Desulfovibrio gilichinskyi]SMF41793.1 hypothetical protein SAMN06295933_3439 [Desulfovibrio gilichinskyi]